MRHMNYKPGYYLSYFIYCMIPVVIYVAYLWRRRNEDIIEVKYAAFKYMPVITMPYHSYTPNIAH
jgi:hypothetical protein